MPVVQRPTTIGWFGEDVVDWVGDRFSDVGEILGNIPLADPLAKAVVDLVEGPMRDFAKTPFGKTVLRAMTTAFYTTTAWWIGPQVAAITFAFPGLVRGEDFEHAWFDEFAWRVETTEQIMGPGPLAEALPPEVTDAVSDLVEKYGPGGGFVPESLEDIADRLGISDWAAAMAKSRVEGLLPKREDFDPQGRSRKRLAEEEARRRAFQEKAGAQVLGTARSLSSTDQRAATQKTDWYKVGFVTAESSAGARANADVLSLFQPKGVALPPPPPVPEFKERAPAPIVAPQESSTLTTALLIGGVSLGALALAWYAAGKD